MDKSSSFNKGNTNTNRLPQSLQSPHSPAQGSLLEQEQLSRRFLPHGNYRRSSSYHQPDEPDGSLTIFPSVHNTEAYTAGQVKDSWCLNAAAPPFGDFPQSGTELDSQGVSSNSSRHFCVNCASTFSMPADNHQIRADTGYDMFPRSTSVPYYLSNSAQYSNLYLSLWDSPIYSSDPLQVSHLWMDAGLGGNGISTIRTHIEGSGQEKQLTCPNTPNIPVKPLPDLATMFGSMAFSSSPPFPKAEPLHGLSSPSPQSPHYQTCHYHYQHPDTNTILSHPSSPSLSPPSNIPHFEHEPTTGTNEYKGELEYEQERMPGYDTNTNDDRNMVSAQKSSSCPHCLKIHSRPSRIAACINKHKGMRPYRCDGKCGKTGCSKAFYGIENLNRHRRNHKKWTCIDCGQDSHPANKERHRRRCLARRNSVPSSSVDGTYP